MQYRKVPFMTTQRVHRTMPGLAYTDPAAVVSGLAGAALMPPKGTPGTTTVRFKSDTTKAAGWPGFFSWLGETHPDVYARVAVQLPRLVNPSQHSSPGSVIAGLAGLGQDDGSDDSSFTFDPSTIDTSSIDAMAPSADEIYASVDTSLPSTAPAQATYAGVTNSAPQTTTLASGQIVSAVAQAASAILPLVQQQQLMSVQLSRAAQGLPPLNTSAYMTAGASTTPALNLNTLLLAGLGVGALVLVVGMLDKKKH